MIMPFGKFKGRYIHKCPSSYLRWLAEYCDWNDSICTAADEEWQIRDHQNAHWEE